LLETKKNMKDIEDQKIVALEGVTIVKDKLKDHTSLTVETNSAKKGEFEDNGQRLSVELS